MSDRGFENLDFYQDSLKLLKAAYRLAGSLPDYERYNLADQLRRAAVSIPLNIAEGYGRYRYFGSIAFLLHRAWFFERNVERLYHRRAARLLRF